MQRKFRGGSGLGIGAALAIACCVPLGVSAKTPEQPVLAPTRDVTVTYRLTGGNTAKVAEKMSITFTKRKICTKHLRKLKSGLQTGNFGYGLIQCMRGLVSEGCGGNPVQKGNGGKISA